MRKYFQIFLVGILAIFAVSFGGMTAFAEEQVYDDIADGEYEINASSSSSAADGFLTGKAVLIVDGKELNLVVSYSAEGYKHKWTKLEGEKPVKEEEQDGIKYFTFEIDKVKSKYDKEMEYAVPGFPGLEDGHEVSYDLILDKEQLENLSIVNEANAKELSYEVDVQTMERYMETVILSEIDGKNEVTFRFNTQEFIDNFEIKQAGEYVGTEDVIVDGDFVEY